MVEDEKEEEIKEEPKEDDYLTKIDEIVKKNRDYLFDYNGNPYSVSTRDNFWDGKNYYRVEVGELSGNGLLIEKETFKVYEIIDGFHYDFIDSKYYETVFLPVAQFLQNEYDDSGFWEHAARLDLISESNGEYKVSVVVSGAHTNGVEKHTVIVKNNIAFFEGFEPSATNVQTEDDANIIFEEFILSSTGYMPNYINNGLRDNEEVNGYLIQQYSDMGTHISTSGWYLIEYGTGRIFEYSVAEDSYTLIRD